MTCVTLAVSFLGEVPFDEAGRAHSVSRARYARRDERFSRLIIIDVMAATSINYFGRDLAGVAPSSRATARTPHSISLGFIPWDKPIGASFVACGAKKNLDFVANRLACVRSLEPNLDPLRFDPELDTRRGLLCKAQCGQTASR